jgi:hypothetical protein
VDLDPPPLLAVDRDAPEELPELRVTPPLRTGVLAVPLLPLVTVPLEEVLPPLRTVAPDPLVLGGEDRTVPLVVLDLAAPLVVVRVWPPVTLAEGRLMVVDPVPPFVAPEPPPLRFGFTALEPPRVVDVPDLVVGGGVRRSSVGRVLVVEGGVVGTTLSVAGEVRRVAPLREGSITGVVVTGGRRALPLLPGMTVVGLREAVFSGATLEP